MSNKKQQVLVVVDYQNDFVDGVLPVPNATEIAQNIQNEINSDKYSDVIYTFDTHTEEQYEGSAEQEIFPDIHCEYGTRGWELHKITPRSGMSFVEYTKLYPENPVEIYENGNEHFFTKTEFDVWTGSKVYPKWVDSQFDKENTEFIVTGVATNYCVFMHVMGLVERGYKVTVKEDCIRGITHLPDGSVDPSFEANIAQMKDAGVVFEQPAKPKMKNKI